MSYDRALYIGPYIEIVRKSVNNGVVQYCTSCSSCMVGKFCMKCGTELIPKPTFKTDMVHIDIRMHHNHGLIYVPMDIDPILYSSYDEAVSHEFDFGVINVENALTAYKEKYSNDIEIASKKCELLMVKYGLVLTNNYID